MASDKHINLESMLPTGSILHGNYRIDGYLSSGGFGNTYVATHILFNETYAIKEFFMKDISERGSDSSSVRVSNAGKTEEFNAQLEKFRKEALRLRKLHNVHIVRVYDLFNENGTSYYVMDFINGENLKERLQRTGQPMAESEIRKVLDQVLDALQEVHGQGLWHMDLKPANVMVDKSGVVKLIDFGASKQFNSDTGGAISTSAVAYTNGYAPREQMERSYDKFGPWTDFYALGAMLYNLLTLKHPPMPGDIDDDTSPDKHEALPMPAKVSPLMRGLVLWLIKTNRKQRPQNVQQIKEFLNPPTPNQTPPPVIDFDQKALVLNVMGKGTIMVFLDGRPIQVPCKLQPQMREMTYHVTATAQANGAVRSEEVGMMIVVPALKQTAAPTISFDPKSFTLNASGKGTVKVYLDGREIEVPCTFPQQMREQSFNVTATAQVDGEVKSEEAHLRVVVPALRQTAAPSINYDAKTFTLNVTGKGELQVLLDGKKIQVPYTFKQQRQEQSFNVTATAQVDGEEKSEEAHLRVVVPALRQTAAPSINYDAKAFTLNVTGKGSVQVLLDGKKIQVPYTFKQQRQEQSFNVTATAQVNGELMSEEARLRVVIPALRQTAAPSINFDPKTFTLNVTGKGSVQVLLDGKKIQVPYTFKQQREEQSFNVTATAQVNGELMSEEARLRVVVPALRQTAVPVINYDAKTFTLNVTGKGAVQVLLDGKKIQVPYTFKRQKRAMTYQVTAMAQDKDELRSETATLQVSVPAAVVVLPATDETQVKTESQAATKLQPEPTNEPVTVVKPEPVKVVHEYETDSQTESKPRKLWPVILAACAGLLLVVGGYALLHNSDPTPTQSDEEVNKEAVEAAAEEVAEQSKVVVENKQVVIPLCADGTSCTYSGPVNADDMPDGEGSVKFENGDRLEGYFTNGNADGTCTYTFKSGDKFEGTMMNNEFEKGKYTLPDGSYFEGSFKDYRPAVGTWYNKTGKVIKKI